MKSLTPRNVWNPLADTLESFAHVLAAAAAKDSGGHDIDYLMDSVFASKGKTLLPVSMILDVSSLLSKYALHKTWCMKALKAMDAFPLPLCVFGTKQICESIVETLQKRLSIDHKAVDDNEYDENFVGLIPHELVGYEGIWKIIFSYHYSSKEENYQVLQKGFKLMNAFASYYPVDLGEALLCICY